MMAGLLERLKGRGKSDAASLPARADKAFADGDLAAALPLIREMAGQGDASALYRLGEIFEFGLGVLQDFAQARDWYEKAAEAGFTDAWVKLGDFYLTGKGNISADEGNEERTGTSKLLQMLSVQPDHAKALYWNRKAVEAGIPAAETRLALQYVYGLGLERDTAAAEKLFLLAAEQGDVIAQRGLGMLYASNEDGEVRYGLAEHWFRAAADAGDHGASAALATLIIHGHVQDGKVEEAFRLMSHAADAGHVEAMLMLGSLYRDGLGTVRDLSAAETWFRRASVRGNRNATLSLGFLLTELIEPRDYISGASIFREAAEQGDPLGQYVLGRLYLNGLGVPQDDEKAAQWLTEAAEQRLLPAVESLAAIYAGGRGVKQDARKAVALFEEAVRLGSVDALYHKVMLVSGDPPGGTSTLDENIAMLEEAAKRGSHAAALQLGILYAGQEDYGRAAHWYLRAVELGSSDGLFNLAFLRLRGLDPEPADGRSGIALLEEAAEAGNRSACWALHNIHAGDEYGVRDEALAQKWLIQAAHGGSGLAAVQLAEGLDDGGNLGVPKAEIIELLEAAASRGEAEAQVKLGLLLAEGRHVPRDAEAAFGRMHRAAEAGHAFAQAWMGDVLSTGQGVLKDEALAEEWYERAAAQGYEGARGLHVISG